MIPVYGYPTVPTLAHVQQAVIEAADSTLSPSSHGPAGTPRGAWLAPYSESIRGVRVDPDRELLVTSGAMNDTLHVVLTALLQPNDEVPLACSRLLFRGLVSMAGGKRPVYAEMSASKWVCPGFRVAFAYISCRTKALILSSLSIQQDTSIPCRTLNNSWN